MKPEGTPAYTASTGRALVATAIAKRITASTTIAREYAANKRCEAQHSGRWAQTIDKSLTTANSYLNAMAMEKALAKASQALNVVSRAL